jgi:hypothetical protein
LQEYVFRAIDPVMAFIVLRRSRNTRSYYLVESYRDDQGKTRRRTLCYLGREQDETDTLVKALTHWEQVREQARKELRKAKGESQQVIRRRIEAAATRIGVITQHIQRWVQAEAERRKREQQAEEAIYWHSFEQLRRQPTEENARSAKRAFLFLAKRHHPDQGGNHDDFLRLKDAYDRALAVWRRIAA